MGTTWVRARRVAAACFATLLVAAAVPAAPAAAATPSLVELRISSRTVDVTTGTAFVTVRAKVARAGGLVAGGVLIGLRPAAGEQEPNYVPVASTDGPTSPTSPAWFTATFRIPRYSSPTVYDVTVDVQDAAGLGSTTFTRARMLTVSCALPDTTQPVLRWLHVTAPSGFPLDVRTSARSIHVTMRITDDLAGVSPATVQVRMRHIVFDGQWFGAAVEIPLKRTAGTARDGWYSGWWRMAKGDLGGDWAVDLTVRDRAHSVGELYTTDLVREPGSRAIPGHNGSFTVRGSGDTARPVLASVRMSEIAAVRTASDGSVVMRVTVTARIKDEGSGVRRVVATITSDGISVPLVSKQRMRPTSGTRYDGVWTFVIYVPAFAADPDGALWLHLGVNDMYWQDWYSADGAWPDGPWRDNRALSTAVLGGGSGSAAIPVI